MSYLTQMLGLATHNFWSAAVGMALAIAFIRGIARREMKTLGNFWVDLTRGTLWVLVPIWIVFSLALVSQGVVQNFKPYDTAKLVESQKVVWHRWEGDGGYDADDRAGASRFARSDQDAGDERWRLLQCEQRASVRESYAAVELPADALDLSDPCGLAIALGQMVGSPKHGWAVFAAMVVLWFAGTLTCYWAESQPNPLLHGVDQHISLTSIRRQHGRQGSSLRYCELGACSRQSLRMRAAAR